MFSKTISDNCALQIMIVLSVFLTTCAAGIVFAVSVCDRLGNTRNESSACFDRRIETFPITPMTNDFELFEAHVTATAAADLPPPVETNYFRVAFGPYYNSKIVTGHVIVVSDPLRAVSVVEPGGAGGCRQKAVQTTPITTKGCAAAINAGFFDLVDHSCLGNVISDGRIVTDNTHVTNAHFGLTKDNKIFSGYLNDSRQLPQFQNLIGGVIWLVRNGVPFVDESMKIETYKSSQAKNWWDFTMTSSARNAIGHDRDGRVMIVHADGRSFKHGLNVYEMADLMVRFGAVNAVNIDGGGSSTVLVNDAIINRLTDPCQGKPHGFVCPRNVSTAICIRRLT
ncbi:N-acetylglucosamine-1-phosphodiester alpha-N-acetylglucosaminidase-like [Tubulanus polymorphus]|uniref:N-acetylglucosamine-1-phosphodiester alpha-N-acetylglucosaminidase-like n=1 Tax=Tubulanus polymorphus TaxID=672921 RepID=UPI003DA6253E